MLLDIGRHELYMNRVKCFKTLSAFLFYPSRPKTSPERNYTSHSGMEMVDESTDISLEVGVL